MDARRDRYFSPSGLLTLALALIGSAASGCVNPFMPLGDYKVFIELQEHYQDDKGYLALARVCDSVPDECGMRKLDEDEYEPDVFQAGSRADIYPLKFWPFYGETPNIQVGDYAGGVDWEDVLPFRLNGTEVGEVSLPPTFALTSPTHEQVFHRGTDLSIPFIWNGGGTEFPMHWRPLLVYNGLGDDPCDALDWAPVSGDEEDDGAFDLPMDIFPENIPPEGCEVAIMLERFKEGTLTGDVAGGIARGSAVDGMWIRLMP